MIQIKRNNLGFLAKHHSDNLKPYLEKKLKIKAGSLFDFINFHLEKIITGEPHVIANEIITNIPSYTSSQKELEAVFNYKYFTNKNMEGGYGAYSLAKLLNVRVCPYCNRQYTFTINNTTGKTRPEFDHYFSQKVYPFLALSFYNLIPSCHLCNAVFKQAKLFNLNHFVHPYVEGFGDEIKFKIQLRNKEKFKPSEIEKWYGINFFEGAYNSFDIEIKKLNPKIDLEKRANNNIATFHLEEIYNEHKDYVIELIQKAKAYHPDYLDSLFNEFEGKLFKSKSELYQMVISNYIELADCEKRVLSKLSRDICLDLGIL